MKIIATIAAGASEEEIEAKVRAVARQAVAEGFDVRLERTAGPEKYLTAQEMSELTGVPAATWGEMMRRRVIAHHRVGGKRRKVVAVADFLAFMEKCRAPARPDAGPAAVVSPGAGKQPAPGEIDIGAIVERVRRRRKRKKKNEAG